MKKITFLLFLLTGFLSTAQTLPLDFELPEDDAFGAFNGAAANVVTDPTDGMNSVLELTSVGAAFDGAAINMATYVDLSDDNNNTVTLRFWAPDATSRQHLLKFEGATNGPPATELYFNTTAAGWQDITLDFGAGLANDYPILVLFADANTAGIGTYYIDDIDGPNGDPIAPDPVPAGPAPVPTYADSDVYSIYNDTNGYTTGLTFAYDFGSVTTIDLDPTAAINNTLKYNFGVAGYGQGEGGPDDISSYDYLTFDYWAGPSGGASGWNVELIHNVGGSVAGFIYQYTAPQEIVAEGVWEKAIIPLSTFTGEGFDSTNFFQWKMDPLGGSVDNSQIVYIDNVLLITADALSNTDFALSDLKVYPNPSNTNWNIKTNNTIIDTIQVVDIHGRQVFNMTPNSSEAIIDASYLSNGVYFARINKSKTIKLVKQ